MRWLLRSLVATAAIASGLAGSSCHAQSGSTQSTGAAPSVPAQTRLLRDFGAVGDGRADDTAALRRAFSNSGQFCLDGEGRSYRVTGTLRVQNDFCLRNTTLVQSLAPFDTKPYIRHRCPATTDVSAVIDCGDPAVPPEDLARLNDSLSVRTLLIRPDRPGRMIRVILDHVKVDRGRYPEEGSRADSAAIWLQGADGASLTNVEITGSGKGYGLFVSRSRNVTVDNLWVHDLVWAPYAGETAFSESAVAAAGWNSVPIHEFRAANQDSTKVAKFYGVRVQEQVTCALFADVEHVLIRNARVSRCMAQFSDGRLPWQADGLDIGRSSRDVTVSGADIDSTWNGMDIVAGGDGVSGLSISDTRVSNSFTFALKFGYDLRDVHVSNVVITNAGIAGIVIYGPVDGASFTGAQVSGVGILSEDGRTFVPWPAVAHSGVVIERGPSPAGGAAAPQNISLRDLSVARSAGAPTYQFGVLNNGGANVQLHGVRASGFSSARAKGVVETQ